MLSTPSLRRRHDTKSHGIFLPSNSYCQKRLAETSRPAPLRSAAAPTSNPLAAAPTSATMPLPPMLLSIAQRLALLLPPCLKLCLPQKSRTIREGHDVHGRRFDMTTVAYNADTGSIFSDIFVLSTYRARGSSFFSEHPAL